jgi:hypothetical protein
MTQNHGFFGSDYIKIQIILWIGMNLWYSKVSNEFAVLGLELMIYMVGNTSYLVSNKVGGSS